MIRILPALIIVCACAASSGLGAEPFDIVITYGVTVEPEMQAAINYAAARWTSWLTTTGSGDAATLDLSVNAADLGYGALAQAAPSWWGHTSDLALTPPQYMIQTGNDLHPTDGMLTLSTSIPWYLGTDANPSPGQYDLVSTFLHEMGHMLGMIDSYREFTIGPGWGYRRGNDWHLTRWDTFLRDQHGDAPAPRGAPEMFDEVGQITFTGPAATAAYGGGLPVYAPAPIEFGSSLAHVDDTATGHALMMASGLPGRALHGLYEYEVGAFTDLGWSFATPAELHSIGSVNTFWQSGSAWDFGLPPKAVTDVHLDAAPLNPYFILVTKESAAASVVVEGPATLKAQAGSLTVGGDLTVRNGGSIELSGATGLSAADQYVGRGSAGGLVQTGGTNSVAGTLRVGYEPGADGTYSISGGRLEADGLYVGDGGSGLFAITDADAEIVIAGLLRFGPDGSLAAVPGSTIHMTGAVLENEATQPSQLAGLGELNLIFEGGQEVFDSIEVAGADYGPAAAGWTDNFVLGMLTLGGTEAGRIRLVDNSDNQPGSAGAEALYVNVLVLNPGATIDFNGLNLYYLNGGDPDQLFAGDAKQLFGGDANLDGLVNEQDLSVLATSFGGEATWAGGDFNGDSGVNVQDLAILATNFGFGGSGGAPVPEPAAAILLVLAGPLVVRRRRRRP